MIHALDDALARLAPVAAPALVLHIGAGPGANLAALGALQPGRLVLVEGDARHHAALQSRAMAEAPERSEVLGIAVSPKGGALDWRRYSLPALDGPVDRTALRAVYPRLRLLEQTRVASIPLAELLTSMLADESAADGARLLLLDLPGQEDALLAALPAGLLAGFDSVIVCGGGRLPMPGAGHSAGAAGFDALTTHGQRLIWSNHEREPLWPVALWQRGVHKRPSVSAPAPAPLPDAAPPTRTADAAAVHPDLSAAQLALAQAEAAHGAALRELQAQLSRERERNDALAHQLDEAEAQIGMLKDLLLREAPP